MEEGNFSFEILNLFEFGNMCEFIGSQNSCKWKILIHFLLQKIKMSGVSFKVLYVDSEGSFSSTYFTDAIISLVNKSEKTKKKRQKLQEQLMNSFIISRVTDQYELISFIENDLAKYLAMTEEYNVFVIFFKNSSKF
jgi:hypothetical protein